MVKVLVTGSSGFIGSHLVEHLIENGYEVRAFVRYTSGHHTGNLNDVSTEIRSEIDFYYGDIRDADAINRAMTGVSMVFHLAAVISVPYSYQHPEETVAVNTNGTLNILRMARHNDLERVIVTSTSEVYGTAQYVPIDELHPRQAQSPYAASKISADALAESFYRTYELPVIIVRPFNTYGPRQSTRAVIPTIITQALTRSKIKLGSLSPSRDLLFVKDTARGFLAAATSDKAVGENINLGTGKSITIGDLAHKIIRLVDKDIEIEVDQERIRPQNSEVLQLQGNADKAHRLLDWYPLTSIDEGLKTTINWMRTHLEGYDPGKYYV